jgi:hypothetical protein
LLLSLAGKTALAVLLVSALAVVGFSQDPTGRPDPKKKPPVTTKKPPVKVEPVPVTVTLTVLTTPPESAVFVNGEERGVTNGEGRIQFDKLPLGHYSIEVRKEGYNTISRGFEAGTESRPDRKLNHDSTTKVSTG